MKVALNLNINLFFWGLYFLLLNKVFPDLGLIFATLVSKSANSAADRPDFIPNRNNLEDD